MWLFRSITSFYCFSVFKSLGYFMSLSVNSLSLSSYTLQPFWLRFVRVFQKRFELYYIETICECLYGFIHCILTCFFKYWCNCCILLFHRWNICFQSGVMVRTPGFNMVSKIIYVPNTELFISLKKFFSKVDLACCLSCVLSCTYLAMKSPWRNSNTLWFIIQFQSKLEVHL